MAKKKSKGVLEKIGNAVAAGAEVVVDAGAKVVHSVGEMMPTGKTPPKREDVAQGQGQEGGSQEAGAAKKATVKAAKPEAKKAGRAGREEGHDESDQAVRACQEKEGRREEKVERLRAVDSKGH